MLFKDIKDFKAAFGGVQRTMEWDTWSPFVNEAEQFFIIPAIGFELYHELNTLVNATAPTLTAKQSRLLSLLKSSTAAYADLMGYYRNLINTGDGGKTITVPKDSQAPGIGMVLAARKDTEKRADTALELAMAFLEDNADDFATWKESASYTIAAKMFVGSATDLTAFFPHAGGSRRMFLKLKGFLEKSQSKYLKTVIGSALYTEWVANISNENHTTTDEETEAWELASNFIVRKAVADAAPYLNISEDWRLVSDFANQKSEAALTKERRDEISLHESEMADKFKSDLVGFLQEKASVSVFASYFNSDLYASRLAKPNIKRFINSKENKFAVL